MSGNINFNGWINDDGSENYKCRAWVNFDGDPVTIRASGNVSSITDIGVGEYTVNFTNAMPDANYSTVISCSENGSASMFVANIGAYSSTSVEIETNRDTVSGYDDVGHICAAIFR